MDPDCIPHNYLDYEYVSIPQNYPDSDSIPQNYPDSDSIPQNYPGSDSIPPSYPDLHSIREFRFFGFMCF